jgi:hypothetical protein
MSLKNIILSLKQIYQQNANIGFKFLFVIGLQLFQHFSITLLYSKF